MKIPYRVQSICSVLLVLFLSAFLSFEFFANRGEMALADDGTPIEDITSEYFVTIYDQGKSLMVKTAKTTVREVLERSEVILAETDLVEPSLDTEITSDYRINIYRARPAIVILGSERHYLMTASYDPKQIAAEAGFTVYDGDTFKVELNQNFLEAGAASTYRLERNGGRTLTVEETLPYTTETRYDANMKKGERYLEQAGEDGRKKTVYSVNFEQTKEVSREKISEEVVKEPVTEIVVVGVKIDIPPERQECAEWVRAAGVSEVDLEAALDLIFHESGCRVNAQNEYSGAYGIPQALPGWKMQEFGEDWETNPVTQIRWMDAYVTRRYGGWGPAMTWWWQHHWY